MRIHNNANSKLTKNSSNINEAINLYTSIPILKTQAKDILINISFQKRCLILFKKFLMILHRNPVKKQYKPVLICVYAIASHSI